MKWTLNGMKTKDMKISDVYDGDTYKIELPVCCRRYVFSCRLLGIDTPEIRSKNKTEKKVGYDVCMYVSKLLLQSDRDIEIHCHDFDKYGRVLCDITLIIGGKRCDLASHLIEMGMGYKYDGGTRLSFKQWYKNPKKSRFFKIPSFLKSKKKY
jgi:micrococcal nuclease